MRHRKTGSDGRCDHEHGKRIPELSIGTKLKHCLGYMTYSSVLPGEELRHGEFGLEDQGRSPRGEFEIWYAAF
jgi:hypothetical protein